MKTLQHADRCRTKHGAEAGPENGSAVAEFVMVSALLTMLFVSVLQLALVLHVRNTLMDAAASGARFGTLADRSPAEGAQRTRELIDGSLGPGLNKDVEFTATTIGGQPGLKITVSTPLPLLGYFAVGGHLHVSGEAARYGG
ncbi:MAG: TadE family protein [Arthrobacter sp.]|uniref:TadE family protein n=1 Tax=unclassified Arthrobacter TaxID=235627 RepID=UPI00264BFDBB|nr:pilus assembly protein [Micrococcaceae bacterium]MDN5813137.1 pilus assembly protein [Micrococcaceae bacterium]MDN5825074.1 pilus assembly protein [Micrococcaceae bacterium]MDN5880218.1 pilus assembly protein [Micrococcaceae bacterium]MDN5887654.1 pilus assembly protein [Micrococcaceae bacterium]